MEVDVSTGKREANGKHRNAAGPQGGFPCERTQSGNSRREDFFGTVLPVEVKVLLDALKVYFASSQITSVLLTLPNDLL